MNIFKVLYTFSVLFFSTYIVAQEIKKDENKIQEVINLDSDPANNGLKSTDTLAAKSLDQNEILKRAIYFVKLETPRYIKSNAITTGTKAEFLATFKYKPKELNPQANVEGTFTMHVSIEAKSGKYRYTITKLNHNARNNDYTGGDLYSEIPNCGSLKLSDLFWKQIRSEGMKQAMSIVNELKETMKISSTITTSKEEW